MFAVSEKFRNAIKQNTRKYEWHGTITTKGGKNYDFTSKDIVKGSGYIKWQCCSDTEDDDRYRLSHAQEKWKYLHYTFGLEILETDGKMKEDVTWNVAGFIGK